jgi:hypothetical protein
MTVKGALPRRSMTTADKLLLRLAEAKRIVRKRLHHMKTTLTTVDERMAERDIPASSFAKLLEAGYLRPVPQDALFDVVDYEFTPKGEAYLRELYEREGERRA